ncbi:MAG TPA: SDR family oxidoreductase [Streptosporangiaceae bacterium]
MAANGRPVVLVTGASRGIGRSSALAFARRDFDVVVNYATSQAGADATVGAVAALGARAIACQADVADEPAVLAMADQVKSAFGRLDVLVSNAGTTIDTPPADLDDLDMAGWDRVFAVNVRGMVQVVRACVPMLRQSPIAAIVTTCSIAGLRPGPQSLPYSASKAAAVNLTKTLAGALGPKIRVNGVAPGWIAGEWMEHQLGGNYDRLMERRARLTPLQRVATHDDVAETIVSLALSNAFVTGQVVVVDGGFIPVT